MEAGRRSKPSIGIKALPIFNDNKTNAKKILISAKSELNGNNISLICNPEKF